MMTGCRALSRLVTVLVLAVAGSGAGAQAPAQVPVEAFFSPAKLQLARLSPSGRWMASLTAPPGRRVGFTIIDLDGKQPTSFIEASPKEDVTWFRWVSDDYLIFKLRSPVDRAVRGQGAGLMAVKRDGSSSRILIAREYEDEDPFQRKRYLKPDHFYLGRGAEGTTEVMIGQAQWRNQEYSHTVPKVLDVATGAARSLPGDVPRGTNFWFDTKGNARVVSFHNEGQVTTWWADKSGAWKQISKAPAYEQPFVPMVVDGDDGLLVTTAAAGDGSTEVRRFDLAAGKPSKAVLLATPGFDEDEDGIVDLRSGRVLGFSATTDAYTQVWLSPAMQALQTKVDNRFQGSVNAIQCEPCDGKSRILIYTYSDRDPGSYVVYTPEDDKWRLLGEVRPDIDPRRMTPLELVRTKARDGHDLPVWVTRPAPVGGVAAKPAPAVVLVHGGPWMRGTAWRFDGERQFLASRGYVVIEPEFRGSKGYGVAHFRAGWKQWGQTMQDDVTDALRFAVAQGWVDKSRVCIMGASYGGYATLMGLVKDPDQYRCGVAFAAVSDPRFMYDFHWSDESESAREYDLPLLLGDRVKDAAMLAAASPLEQVARIKAPLLLSHGGRDRRVPIENAERMLEALRKNGKQVDWVLYPEEGHGFFYDENRYDYYRKVDAFLAKYLK